MEQSQQDFLREAKAEIAKAHPGITWDDMALMAGIMPRALKTYRMPDSSKDHRSMGNLERRAVEDAVKKAKKRVQKIS